MSHEKSIERRAAAKDRLADKYESLVKVTGSIPKRKTYLHRLKMYRRQAEDIRREK